VSLVCFAICDGTASYGFSVM